MLIITTIVVISSPLYSVQFLSCFFHLGQTLLLLPAPMLPVLPGLMVHFIGTVHLISLFLFFYWFIHIFFSSFWVSAIDIRQNFLPQKRLSFRCSLLYALSLVAAVPSSFTPALAPGIHCLCFPSRFWVLTHCTTQSHVAFFFLTVVAAEVVNLFL